MGGIRRVFLSLRKVRGRVVPRTTLGFFNPKDDRDLE
jgi:hypothetical protein